MTEEDIVRTDPKLRAALNDFVKSLVMRAKVGPDRQCIGLDPDTDPCPFCGAALFEPCGQESSNTSTTEN